ncbi:MAG: hypothetical protein II355_04280, partial [Bacteroidales bacterium]|nr:hypothetical protein [Bacteroidales bacterium]
MKKYIIALILCIAAFQTSHAQDEEIVSLSDEAFFKEEKKVLINDYDLIGANYGVTFTNMMFNP